MKKIVTPVWLLSAAILLFSACKNSPTEPEPEPQDPTAELTAEIAYSPSSPEVGAEVTLDATKSEDTEDIGFEVQWSFKSKPDASTATIDAPQKSVTSFTTDAPGDYVVQLVVSNSGEGVSDTTETTVASSAANPVEISGDIKTDTTLEDIFDDPDAIDYLMVGNIGVNAQLSIEPGVVVHVQEDFMMSVNANGTLIAEGAEADSIEFTTANREGGLRWKGIFVNSSSSQNSLKYVKLSHAGNSSMDFAGHNYKAGIGVNEAGKIKVTHSRIFDNDGYGLYVDNDGGILEDFSDNSFSGNVRAVGVPADEVEDIDVNTTFDSNTEAEVEIFATTYSDTKSSTWQSLREGASYRVSGDLTVNGKLSIAAGARFEFDEDVLVQVYGELIARGTADNRIEFTTSNKASSIYWKGIYIASSSALNKLEYVKVSYAGNSAMDFSGSNYPSAVGIEEGGKVSVLNSWFADNKGYGLYVDNEGGLLESFSQNTFEKNTVGVGIPANEVDDMDTATVFKGNNEAQVEVFATTLVEGKEVTWNELEGEASYRVIGDLNIAGALTIAPGAKFEMDEDVQVTVNGALIAEGTSDKNITFTSSNVAGNIRWMGIFILSSDSRNSLDYVHVAYGGSSAHDFSGDNFKASIGVNSDALLSITNCTISDGGGYGIYSKGFTNDFTTSAASNTFTGNVNGNNLNSI